MQPFEEVESITACQSSPHAILAQYKAGDTVSIKVFSFSRNFSKGEERTLTFVLDSAA